MWRTAFGVVCTLFVCLVSCVGAEVALVRNTTANTLAIEYVSVFKGEFPCMHPNVSGTRRLLRFESEIFNPTRATQRFETVPPLSYRIATLANTTLMNGTVALPCLRDTFCQGGTSQTYYTCTPPAISPQCSTVTARHTICHWIDITLLPQDIYNLQLTFANSSIEMPFDVFSLPRIARGGAARIAVAMSTHIIIALAVIFVPWCLWHERDETPKASTKTD